MKFLLSLFFVLPAFANATPKVNTINCMYVRSSPSDTWSYAGYSGSIGDFDLPDGEYTFDFANWSFRDGRCYSYIGNADDTLTVNGYLFEGEDIQFIDENCVAQGTSIHKIAAGQKRIARGETMDLVGSYGDGSQELMHILFTPYEHLGEHVLDYAREYCSTRTP